MPRRHRRREEESSTESRRPATTTPMGAPPGWQAERHRGGEGPDYTCPRCHRPVRRASEHVVAWRTDDDERHRHWHGNCWTSAVREGIDKYRWG